MNRANAFLAAALLIMPGLAARAEPENASRPWPRTLIGCVFKGIFVTHDGFPIGVSVTRLQRLDLTSYEGMELSIAGNLLPGDLFIAKGDPSVIGPCPKRAPDDKS